MSKDSSLRFAAYYLDEEQPHESRVVQLLDEFDDPGLVKRLLGHMPIDTVSDAKRWDAFRDVEKVAYLLVAAFSENFHGSFRSALKEIDRAAKDASLAHLSRRTLLELAGDPNVHVRPDFEAIVYRLIRSENPLANFVGGDLLEWDLKTYRAESGVHLLCKETLLELGAAEVLAATEERKLRTKLGRTETGLAEARGRIASLEEKLRGISLATPAVAAVPPLVPVPGTVARAKYDSLKGRYAELRRDYTALEARLKTVESANGQTLDVADTPAVDRRAPPLYAPLRVVEMKALLATLGGKSVLTIGGYFGNAPDGSTRSYLAFLENDVGMRVDSVASDERPAIVSSRAQRAERIIFFTYINEHEKWDALGSVSAAVLRVASKTYDETRFARELYTRFVEKTEK